MKNKYTYSVHYHLDGKLVEWKTKKYIKAYHHQQMIAYKYHIFPKIVKTRSYKNGKKRPIKRTKGFSE